MDNDIVRFWFKPRSVTANTLASKVMAAGHKKVVVEGGLVGLVPFENRKDAFQWVKDMEAHFDAIFMESR